MTVPRIAILYYDYLLTFGDEVRFFWRRRPGSVTILFFVNRYLSIVGNVPVILQSFRSWGGAVRFSFFFSLTRADFSWVNAWR